MLKRFFEDFRKYYRYSVVSAKAHLKSDVAGSYLNWIWWILDPLCFMLIYSFIFGYVFNTREQYFSVYIFIGLTMWNFFNKTLQGSVKLVKVSKSVVSKVYFPKFVLVLSKIWVNGFKMLISFGIVAVMMVIYQIPLTANVFFAIPILIVLILLTFGFSCFLLHYGVYVQDLSNITSIVLKVFFYMSGVFYNLETRIPEYGALLNRCIPSAFLLTSMRKCLIYGEMPNLKILLLWFAIGVLLCVLGIRKIYREENSYVKAI